VLLVSPGYSISLELNDFFFGISLDVKNPVLFDCFLIFGVEKVGDFFKHLLLVYSIEFN